MDAGSGSCDVSSMQATNSHAPWPVPSVTGGCLRTGAERLAELRARRRKEGLKPHEVWAHPKDWPLIQRFVERLAKRRNAK